MMVVRLAVSLCRALGSAFLEKRGVAMEAFLAVLQLLTHLFGVTKAYLELKRSNKDNDHDDAQRTTRRPKHLR